MPKPISRHALEFLASFNHELLTLKQRILLFNECFRRIGYKQFLLDGKIIELWDELEKCVSPISPHLIWEPYILDQPVTISHWVQELKDSTQFVLKPPSNMYNMEIWQDQEKFYWSDLFLALGVWAALVDTTVNTIEWASTLTDISLRIKWNGAFPPVVMIDTLEVTEQNFFIVPFRNSLTTCAITKSNRLLLYIQLTIKHRGGDLSLSLNDTHEHLLMQWIIPRVTSSSHYLSASPISSNTIDQIVNYIINQVPASYTLASQELENTLQEIINGWTLEEIKMGDIEKQAINIPLEVISQLSSFREIMTILENEGMEVFVEQYKPGRITYG